VSEHQKGRNGDMVSDCQVATEALPVAKETGGGHGAGDQRRQHEEAHDESRKIIVRLCKSVKCQPLDRETIQAEDGEGLSTYVEM
jgi:hypothetical protein